MYLPESSALAGTAVLGFFETCPLLVSEECPKGLLFKLFLLLSIVSKLLIVVIIMNKYELLRLFGCVRLTSN